MSDGTFIIATTYNMIIASTVACVAGSFPRSHSYHNESGVCASPSCDVCLCVPGVDHCVPWGLCVPGVGHCVGSAGGARACQTVAPSLDRPQHL